MSVAVDARASYFGTKLSENIAETPEGYLICRNTVIGRSGFQDYFVSELTDPEGLLDGLQQDGKLEIWRDVSEVFSPATLASFEGKTFTLRHPEELLSPDDEQENHRGHIQNVRKGSEPLDSGDWPMLADVLVTDKEAIAAIRSGERELSCGYSYQLAKNGERYEQRSIVGNHVALVEHARAGADARIYDSAPLMETRQMTKIELVKKLFGIGLKEFAKDAKPEELAAAFESAEGLGMVKPEVKAEPAKVVGLVYRKIGATKDGVDIFRSFASDAEAEEAEKKAAEEKAKDAKDGEPQMTDAGKRMHAAVDRLLAMQGEKAKSEDADLQELKTMLGSLYTEEENKAGKDAMDPAKEDKAEDNEVAPISLSDEEKEEEKKKAEDAAKDAKEDEDKKAAKAEDDSDIVNAEPVLAPGDVPQSQFDDGAVILKSLKPLIARSGDKKLIAAFDTITRARNLALRKAGTPDTSYDLFGQATRRSIAGDAKQEPLSVKQKEAAEMDLVYANELKRRSLRKKSVA